MASTKTWLTELKLRAGYGSVGNDRMGNYNSYTQFTSSMSDSAYPLTGSQSSAGNTGFRQATFGNTDVKMGDHNNIRYWY